MAFKLNLLLFEFSTLSKLVTGLLATDDDVVRHDEGREGVPSHHGEDDGPVDPPDPPDPPRVGFVGLGGRGEGRGRPGQRRRPLLPPEDAPGRASAAFGTRSRRPGDARLPCLATPPHVRPHEGLRKVVQEDEEEARHHPEEDGVDDLVGGGRGRGGGDLGEEGGHHDEAGQRHHDAVAATAGNGARVEGSAPREGKGSRDIYDSDSERTIWPKITLITVIVIG